MMRYVQVGGENDYAQPRRPQYIRLSSGQDTSTGARYEGTKLSYIWFHYALNGACLFIIVAASLSFWVVGYHRPILLPFDLGLRVRANPKFTTIFCTVTGALFASWTVWLLNNILVVMSKQVISAQGTSLSTLEVWHRMFNKDFIIDGRRLSASAITITFWVAVLFLGTGFTSLITPTSILIDETIRGTELDFNSEAFWQWYNYQDAQGNFNRTVMGCKWAVYTNSKGTTTFPTCPYNSDPINFLNAGFAAAQYGSELSKPSVNYLDKHYEGSTGGTLPLGWAGFPAFTDVDFDHWRTGTTYPTYNYTLKQQGLTAEVVCEETPGSPLVMTQVGYVNSSIPGLSNAEARLAIVNFTWTCPSGFVASSGNLIDRSSSTQIALPRLGWATLVICQTPPPLKEYTVYLATYGAYTEPAGLNGVVYPNLTCTVKPMITESVVEYRSSDTLFRVLSQAPIVGSGARIPNETYQAIDRAFSLATSNTENMVIDSINGFRKTNSSVSVANATADTFRGYIEFQATNLRMYYAANEPPGSINVTGNYTVWRVGYRGQPIVLASLLPPLLLVSGLALYYLFIGISSGSTNVPLPSFDPVDSLSILLAGAAGQSTGRLPAYPSRQDIPDKQFLKRMTVRFESDTGYVVAHGKTPSTQDLELDPMNPEVPNRQSVLYESNPRRPSSPFLTPFSPYQDSERLNVPSMSTPPLESSLMTTPPLNTASLISPPLNTASMSSPPFRPSRFTEHTLGANITQQDLTK